MISLATARNTRIAAPSDLGRHDGVLWWGGLGAICVVLLAPLVLVDIPPILDYPNHLARLYFLAHGTDDPMLSRFYAVRWGVIPDLAIDSFGPLLLRVFPVYVAGRIVLGLVLLLTVGGIVAYSRAVFGGRRPWALAGGLVVYNLAFLFGFLNFLVSLGLAMLFAAAWIVWRERRPVASVAFGVAAGAVLFFAHLMGVAFYLVLVGSAELEAVWRLWRGGARSGPAVMRRGLPVAALTVVPLALYAFTRLERVPDKTRWADWSVKAWQMICGFINYDFALDMVSAALVFGLVIACLATGRARVAPKAVAAFVALIALYAALPEAFKGTNLLDLRPAVMFALLMFAGFTPVRLPRRIAALAAASVAVLFGVRMGAVAVNWSAHQADVNAYREVIALIPPGSRVFVLDVPQREAPRYWMDQPDGRLLSVGYRIDVHMSAMILIERHAFWPGQFADPAQQPVVRRPPYDELTHYFWDLPGHAALARSQRRLGEHGSSPFARLACHADFVLLTQAGADDNLAAFGAGYLDLLKANDLAALFRVRATDHTCPIAAKTDEAPG